MTMMTDSAGTPRPYIPALARLYAPLAPYSWSFVRFCAGVLIVWHGWPKIFAGGTAGLAGLLSGRLGLDPGIVWAWVVALTEVVGGAFLAVGFLTRLAAIPLCIEFLVIVFVIKWANGLAAFSPLAIGPNKPGMIPGGFELEMLLGLICFAALFGGGGRLSVDRALGREV